MRWASAGVTAEGLQPASPGRHGHPHANVVSQSVGSDEHSRARAFRPASWTSAAATKLSEPTGLTREGQDQSAS
jgi:hypothetical protein